MIGDLRVLQRFEPRPSTGEAFPADCAIGAYIDTETTGMDHDVDRIVELAVRPFAFDKNGLILGVGVPYTSFNDPGFPMPQEALDVHGITDEMVQGHKINVDAVAAIIADVDVVIAHNAAFDRKFCETEVPRFATKRWACSWREIEWKKRYSAACGNLGHLLMDLHHQFHDAHRALDDCDVGVALLGTPDVMGRTALSHLWESMKKPTYRVWANGAPYAMKDTLKKERKYKWHDGEKGHTKAWYKDCGPEWDDERAWLVEHGVRGWQVEKFTAIERYSTRMDP
jgi:DNA polymerase-3 subunit epsilon